MTDELIQKIADAADADEDDVRQRIEDKMEELSGLVSEEGAAHLIAREEGVDLQDAEESELKVDNVVPGMNRVDLKAKVTDITDINEFSRDDGDDGKVRNLVLGDETGTLRMSLWDEQVDIGEKLDVGDVIAVSGAYSREDNRGNPELRIGDSTNIQRIEEEIDAVSGGSSRRGGGGGSAAELAIRDVMTEDQTVQVTGTVVEIYADDPFYRACPECQKKVEEEDGAFRCDEHGQVEAGYNMILSAIIDDGTGNIRTVFFRDRAKELLDASDVEFEGDAELVQEHAADVKGREVTVEGRSRYNDFFNRIELIGNSVAFETADEMLEAMLADAQ